MTLAPGLTGTLSGTLTSTLYADADDALVFHALDDVGGSFVNDVITGVGVLTEANTSTRYR